MRTYSSQQIADMVEKTLRPKADEIVAMMIQGADQAGAKGVTYNHVAPMLKARLEQAYPEVEPWQWNIFHWVYQLLRDSVDPNKYVWHNGVFRTAIKKRGPRALRPGEVEVEGIRVPAPDTKKGLAMHLFAYLMEANGGTTEGELMSVLKSQDVHFNHDQMPADMRHACVGKLWTRRKVTESEHHPSGTGRLRKGSYLYTLLPSGQVLVDNFKEYLGDKLQRAGELDWRPEESMPEDFYAADLPVKESTLRTNLGEVRQSVRNLLRNP